MNNREKMSAFIVLIMLMLAFSLFIAGIAFFIVGMRGGYI